MTEEELKTRSSRVSDSMGSGPFGSLLTFGETLSDIVRDPDVANSLWGVVDKAFTRAGWKLGIVLNHDTNEVGICWTRKDGGGEAVVLGVLPEPFADALRPLVKD